MKKFAIATTFLAAFTATALAHETDPAVRAVINSLADQFESASGRALDESLKDGYRAALAASLERNIREGMCREIALTVTVDGHELTAHEDICRIDGSFVVAPDRLRVPSF